MLCSIYSLSFKSLVVIIGIKTSTYLLANALTLQLYFANLLSYKQQSAKSDSQQSPTASNTKDSRGV